jgi:hypothetical protein
MDTPFAQLHHHIKEQSRQPQTRQNCRTGMHLLLCSRKGLALGAPARICPSSLSASRWSGVRCISRLCCGCCGRSCCLSDAMAGCGSACACACACASWWWFGARGAAGGPFAVLAATLRALLDPRVMSMLWRKRSRCLVCRYRFGRGQDRVSDEIFVENTHLARHHVQPSDMYTPRQCRNLEERNCSLL